MAFFLILIWTIISYIELRAKHSLVLFEDVFILFLILTSNVLHSMRIDIIIVWIHKHILG
jgi:hypothetical protein